MTVPPRGFGKKLGRVNCSAAVSRNLLLPALLLDRRVFYGSHNLLLGLASQQTEKSTSPSPPPSATKKREKPVIGQPVKYSVTNVKNSGLDEDKITGEGCCARIMIGCVSCFGACLKAIV